MPIRPAGETLRTHVVHQLLPLPLWQEGGRCGTEVRRLELVRRETREGLEHLLLVHLPLAGHCRVVCIDGEIHIVGDETVNWMLFPFGNDGAGQFAGQRAELVITNRIPFSIYK